MAALAERALASTTAGASDGAKKKPREQIYSLQDPRFKDVKKLHSLFSFFNQTQSNPKFLNI